MYMLRYVALHKYTERVLSSGDYCWTRQVGIRALSDISSARRALRCIESHMISRIFKGIILFTFCNWPIAPFTLRLGKMGPFPSHGLIA